IGEPSAVDVIVHALKDWYVNVREHAALALGAIGDDRGIEPLIRTLRCALALARSSPSRSDPALREAFRAREASRPWLADEPFRGSPG
ncbi:MAG: HEAT repeat domain-containing protein, partial [Myxococcales bacterium]